VNKLSEIRLIGFGLIVLYATSLLVYLVNHDWVIQGDVRSAIMTAFFILLFVGSIAMVQLKEWGRSLVVFTNLAMGVYLLAPYLSPKDLVPVSYIFMNFIIFMFFSQSNIRALFSKTTQMKWKTILIVDDDPTQLLMARGVLVPQGFSVLTANTGEEGLVIVKTQKPDLVILDVILPGIKGREVCKRIKEDPDSKNIPVIFMTAKSSMDDIDAEKGVGAYSHLTKPVNAKILVSTVQQALNLTPTS
jgi:CheY-like chemotaxis protein